MLIGIPAFGIAPLVFAMNYFQRNLGKWLIYCN